ncbi:retropepsin-like aspartic protease [Brevundimonas kwangchunensis]|uniref:Retropepsin-like aspartic protease n=1 Tax=Brevundimonas kwangchunensis TaxID=322163 RepID=A0ABN1GPP9_9CAUL
MIGTDHARGVDRRLVLTGLAAGLTTSGLAWPAIAGQEPSPGADGPEQPIQLLANLFTRVGAEVMINNRGPFTFVVDTGAGATSIADTVAAQLNLPAGPPMIVHGITTASVVQSAAVSRLHVSGIPFNNLRCPILPRDQLGADGLIGLDALGRFKLKFNVSRMTASLTLPGLTVVMGGTMSIGSRLRRNGVRAIRGRFGQLILTEVVVEGQPVAAFIDSGAQYSIGNHALRQAMAARRVRSGRFVRTIPLFGVTGQSLQADLARVDDLRLGPSRLGPTPLLFADLHCFNTLGLADEPALLIGADLLGRFREVTLDFPANRVVFEGLRRQTTRTIEDELNA